MSLPEATTSTAPTAPAFTRHTAPPIYKSWGPDLIRYQDPFTGEWLTEAKFSERFNIPKSTLRTWRHRDKRQAAAEGGAK